MPESKIALGHSSLPPTESLRMAVGIASQDDISSIGGQLGKVLLQPLFDHLSKLQSWQHPVDRNQLPDFRQEEIDLHLNPFDVSLFAKRLMQSLLTGLGGSDGVVADWGSIQPP